MGPAARIDSLLVAELVQILQKLATSAPATSFTKREEELIARLRSSRDAILPHLYSAMRTHRGANEQGKEKLKKLVEALERICGD
jgi:hypothetical protein